MEVWFDRKHFIRVPTREKVKNSPFRISAPSLTRWFVNLISKYSENYHRVQKNYEHCQLLKEYKAKNL